MAYQSKLKNDTVDLFFDAVLSLENKEDCYRFFEDVCTVAELQSLAMRFKVATLLNKKMTYQQIEASVDTSAATISRISRCLFYGADGYKRVIEKLEKSNKKKKK